MPDAEELEMILDRQEINIRNKRSIPWKTIMEPTVEQDALDDQNERREGGNE